MVKSATNPTEEGNFIADAITGLIENGYEYCDIAVLYRNNYQLQIIEETLLKKGIPCQVIGGHDFMDRKEIKDIISYLRVAVNPNDQVALRKIIKTRNNKVGKKSIDKLSAITTRTGMKIYEIFKQEDKLKKLGKKVSIPCRWFAIRGPIG